MLCDAHNHLHDKRLKPYRQQIFDSMEALGITKCVVNGTHPDDWEDVLELWEEHPDVVIPALGLHPWRVHDRPDDWFQRLTGYVAQSSKICIGECGLDRWIRNPNIAAQKKCFTHQLELAAAHNRPISIHCLKAWGPLIDVLSETAKPKRGIHLHGFGGSAEVAERLVGLGARFSFCGYFLTHRKQAVREVFAQLPADRLMIETDAPDMLPPPEHNQFPLENNLNSPANLKEIADQLAKIRRIPQQQLLEITRCNFQQYFES